VRLSLTNRGRSLAEDRFRMTELFVPGFSKNNALRAGTLFAEGDLSRRCVEKTDYYERTENLCCKPYLEAKREMRAS
jgi:hypothetical protein